MFCHSVGFPWIVIWLYLDGSSVFGDEEHVATKIYRLVFSYWYSWQSYGWRSRTCMYVCERGDLFLSIVEQCSQAKINRDCEPSKRNPFTYCRMYDIDIWPTRLPIPVCFKILTLSGWITYTMGFNYFRGLSNINSSSSSNNTTNNESWEGSAAVINCNDTSPV
jgi:hypothetical protein